MTTRKIVQCIQWGMTTIPLIATSQKKTQPNIILILADDLGWNDLSCMGSQYYETPHIDQLAKRGTTFTNAYAACQVSSPSRASILTGKYPTRHGITNWIGEPAGEKWRNMNRNTKLLPPEYARALDTSEITLPEHLRLSGYTTFMAGKWHLGDVGSQPEDHGFDINKGGWESGGPRGGYFSPYQNPKLTDGPPGENLSMRLSHESISFIKNHTKQNNKKPFFVYLSFYAVHGPIQTTQQKWSYFRHKAQQRGIAPNGFLIDRTLPVRQTQDNPVYAGLLQQMDDAIGLLLSELQRMGVDKNTMIIFTSDNGGVTSGDAFSTALLPLRGGKGRQWEGGIRVPLIIHSPYSSTHPTTNHTPVIGTDLYPTILDFASIPPPPSQHLDGISIIPLMQGETIAHRPLFWHYPHYGNQGGEPCSIIRSADWKLIRYHEDSRIELYNLSIDISESEPLNAQFPHIVTSLNNKLSHWLLLTNAQMPIPDPLYSPLHEKTTKERWRTTVLPLQEKLRHEMLSPEWSPNKDWWGSLITKD